MSDIDNPQNTPHTPVVIYYDEPQTKNAPMLEVGALAWVRKNLFSTPLDVILTVLGALLMIGVLVSFITWSVQDANWFAITFNFRQFMLGRFSAEQEGRIVFLMLFIAATSGAAIAAYMRRTSRVTLGLALAVILPIFLLPPLVNQVVPLPTSYLMAGNTPIVSGTQEEDPIPQVAFTAAGGETISFRFAEASDSDAALSNLHGFMDDASNALRNAAENRLENIQRSQDIQNRLVDNAILAGTLPSDNVFTLENGLSFYFDRDAEAGERVVGSGLTRTLTANQIATLEDELEDVLYSPPEADAERIAALRDTLGAVDAGEISLSDVEVSELETELARLTLPPTIGSIYALNTQPVELRILDRTLEPIGDAQTLTPDAEARFTIPADGWYVLEKSAADPENDTAVLLAVQNIYPLFARSGERFSRATDGFTVVGEIPEVDGETLPYVTIIDNQFRGQRELGTYLRVYLAPFFALLTPGLLQMLIVGILAYAATRLLDQQFGQTQKPGQYAQRIANWLLIATPLMMFVLINGIGIGPLEVTDQRLWGGLLLAAIITVWGIIIAFPLGVLLALGRRSNLPAVKYLCTLVIEIVRGTPFIVVLFAGQLLIPLIHPDFASIPNVYRALAATIIFIAAYLAENVRGGLQSIDPGQAEAGRAIGLADWQITLFIMLPQALRAVIPALVGQFISLFKDTSLLAIVGLIDLTGVVNTMVVQTEFANTRREGLLFISIIYFGLSYIMSYVSRRIEASGSGATRRI